MENVWTYLKRATSLWRSMIWERVIKTLTVVVTLMTNKLNARVELFSSLLQVQWFSHLLLIYCCEISISSLILVLFNIISDLQVKVFPATGEKTVSLMCSSSCPLTERPVVYVWYKNTEFLYEDLSPWYQELISSEESVTYSCAVKGYEHLRAPEVSVGEWQHVAPYPADLICKVCETLFTTECCFSFVQLLSHQPASLWPMLKAECAQISRDQKMSRAPSHIPEVKFHK